MECSNKWSQREDPCGGDHKEKNGGQTIYFLSLSCRGEKKEAMLDEWDSEPHVVSLEEDCVGLIKLRIEIKVVATSIVLLPARPALGSFFRCKKQFTTKQMKNDEPTRQSHNMINL